MWWRVRRGALWTLSVLMVSAGGGMLHAAFTGYRHEPFETFLGLAVALTGAAIYWHAIRWQ